MDNPYAPPAAPVQDIAVAAEERVLAERLPRLGAAILDSIIFGAMVYLPGFLAVGGLAFGSDDFRAVAVGAAILVCLIGFSIWAWFTVKYVRANGQSIAKRMMNIKVVRTNGDPASLGRIFWLRNIVPSAISAIPFVGFIFGIANVLFIFSESRQCLHDRIADTIVVVA